MTKMHGANSVKYLSLSGPCHWSLLVSCIISWRLADAASCLHPLCCRSCNIYNCEVGIINMEKWSHSTDLIQVIFTCGTCWKVYSNTLALKTIRKHLGSNVINFTSKTLTCKGHVCYMWCMSLNWRKPFPAPSLTL
jgi:hypothetical protein